MDSEKLQHPELILNQYRVNLLNKLKLTAILIICREVLWITYILLRIISLPRNFNSILTIFMWVIYGLIIVLISYYNLPRLLDSKLALNNISILKEKPLYLSNITETIFLLYKRFPKSKKEIEDLQNIQDDSMFISFFEEKIKHEKTSNLVWIMSLFSMISLSSMAGSYDDFINLNPMDILIIIILGLMVLINLKITKYSKSWLESYSNLSHWNQFFSDYEITPKSKELNLLERDFQQFEEENLNQKNKCPVCNMDNDPYSNYCDSCGNELKHRGNRN